MHNTEELIKKSKLLYEEIKNKDTDVNCYEKIEPLKTINKDKIANKEYYEKIGENLIKNNQYAVVTMAGGQGTRLGYDGPKGTFILDIDGEKKYIFQIIVEILNESKEKFGVLPYWYIMTSKQNDEQTKEFLEEHSYFGYDKGKVNFFSQGELPLLTADGELVIEDGKVKTAADGNGGIYSSLKNSGMLDKMKKDNVKWVYTCSIDNIVAKPIDALFLGLTIESKKQIASKAIVKNCPEERVGVFCKRDGKPTVIEYIELTDDMRNLRDENGELVYGESHFMNNLYTVDAIEKIANAKLPYHVALKKGLYKFETFIFDAFPLFDDMLVMVVNREEEFAPIKNKEGVDSPETAIQIYKKAK